MFGPGTSSSPTWSPRSPPCWRSAPRARLVLLWRVVASEALSRFAIVGGSGAFAAELPEGGPGQDVFGGVQCGQDQGGEQASDHVDGQPGQAARVFAASGPPFAFSLARTMVRNAAAAMDRVMWAYQALPSRSALRCGCR